MDKYLENHVQMDYNHKLDILWAEHVLVCVGDKQPHIFDYHYLYPIFSFDHDDPDGLLSFNYYDINGIFSIYDHDLY